MKRNVLEQGIIVLVTTVLIKRLDKKVGSLPDMDELLKKASERKCKEQRAKTNFEKECKDVGENVSYKFCSDKNLYQQSYPNVVVGKT